MSFFLFSLPHKEGNSISNFSWHMQPLHCSFCLILLQILPFPWHLLAMCQDGEERRTQWKLSTQQQVTFISFLKKDGYCAQQRFMIDKDFFKKNVYSRTKYWAVKIVIDSPL